MSENKGWMNRLDHVKAWGRVMCRANIAAFVIGIHGLGKTSIFYQLYLEMCAEKKVVPESFDVFRSGLFKGTKDKVDETSLSSVDAKHLSRFEFGLDDFGLWSVSAANMTLEELVGMPQVEDRGSIYRQAWFETLKAAANASSRPEMSIIKELHGQLFGHACEELGLTKDDKDHYVLRYLRMHNLLPDPRHRGGGMWIIDELNLGFPEVERAFMQILLEKRYLDYVLPDNIWPVTTMNPPSSTYPNARELSLPTMDRGAMIMVDGDKGEWMKWASRRGLAEGTRIFVDRHGDKFLNPARKDIDALAFDNPGTYRSVELTDRAYAVMTEAEIHKVGPTVACSLLGREAGVVYHRERTQTMHKPLALKDVLDGYGWRPGMAADAENDIDSWTVTKSRARLQAMIGKANVQSELIRFTLTELANWSSDLADKLRARGHTKSKPAFTEEERGQLLNMMLFLVDIPVDLGRAFLMEDLGPENVKTLLEFSGQMTVTRRYCERVEIEFKSLVEEEG
jgi:hypothetical protein